MDKRMKRNKTARKLSYDYQFDYIVASDVFGSEALKTIFSPSRPDKRLTLKSILKNTNVYIQKELDAIKPSVTVSELDTRLGRLGVSEVRFDSMSQVGNLSMSADKLQVQGQSNFSTVKANVCFYSGKWQYEIHLESKGVMQLGWSMALGDFSSESGVGDTVYSFSYDGNRVRKWNLVTSEYGEPWQIGDVIGCTIDLVNGHIHFYRNGNDLGEAFSCIPLGPGCAYYPAISLAFEEKLQANFGSTPLKYPITPYLPAQQPPEGAVLRANQVLQWFSCILNHNESISRNSENESNTSLPEKKPTQAAALLFSEILLTHLVGLLRSNYVIEFCFVPFLQTLMYECLEKQDCDSKEDKYNKLNFFCNVLKFFLEPDDLNKLMQAICKCLIQQFNQTANNLGFNKQSTVLTTLSFICQNSYLRQILLKQQGFLKKSLPQFMDLKPIDIQKIKTLPSWWNLEEYPKDEEDVKKKQIYILCCETIGSKSFELQELQVKFLMLLLNNTEEDNVGITKATSRQYFLPSFRLFLKDTLTGLNHHSLEQTPLPVSLNYFYCLLSVLKKQNSYHSYLKVSPELFYNGSIDYFSLERLGGVLSHLITTYREQLVKKLGEGHRVLTEPQPEPPTQPRGLQIQVTTGMDGGSGITSQITQWFGIEIVQREVEPPSVEVSPSIDKRSLIKELLDGVILLYHVCVHKQLYKVSLLRDDMYKNMKTIDEAKAKLKFAQANCPEAVAAIESSIKVLEDKVDEQARVGMAWVRGTIFTEKRREQLFWLLQSILMTLKNASSAGDLFAFVPDFYFKSMVEICTALRNYFSPTVSLERVTDLHIKNILIEVSEFLVDLSIDSRVVNLSTKDTIIEALAGFVANKVTMECLEKTPEKCQIKFIHLLLMPYDNRPWAQTNWILMRMWQGHGFAFRYKTSPHLSKILGSRTPSDESAFLIHQSFEPCPSRLFQRLIAFTLKKDQEMAADFLNSVLKQLNWSFSEFISMMQEIQNFSKRPQRVIIDAHQLKICATCFDFVISLLRVLEMVCSVSVLVFTDKRRPSTENLLDRLSQLLGQILLRVTSPTGCFIHVISLDVPNLDSIHPFPVLSAVAGVIVALLATDIEGPEKTEMSPAIKSLLSEPAFQLDTLKLVLGGTDKHNKLSFSLADYPQEVSAKELEDINRVVKLLEKYQARLSESVEVEEEELCPICCALPITVTFMPCQHRSCKSCITHHLMDCKECFFCKTTINTVISNEGKLIFDAATTAHKCADLNQTL